MYRRSPLLVSFLLIACQGPIKLSEVRSDLSRESPSIASADLQSFAADNAAFATKLHLQIAEPDQNLVFSPHSISIALAMTYGGAKGSTASEMASALEYKLPGQALHDAFNSLDQTLATRAFGKPDDKQRVSLAVANALFAEKTYTWKPDYLDLLARSYGAGVNVADFASNAETERATINAWVEDKTEDRIKELLTKGTVSDKTRFVLVNAIYLNATWAMPFEETNTRPGTFNNASGSASEISFMRNAATYDYADTPDARYALLPYARDELALVVAVPKEGKFAAVEANPKWIEQGRAASKGTLLSLAFPKLELQPNGVSLKTALQALGMNQAFSDEADFSGMSELPLQISDVIHKAFILIDEKGTEAAAATAVVGAEATSVNVDTPTPFVVDQPFLFAIIDKTTGAILFQGRVVTL